MRVQLMDFSTIKTEAVNFLSESSTGLLIVKVDEEKCQIHLASKGGNITFYISCPSSDSSLWNVWSDCAESQKVLQYVMDSCNLDACHNISAVLKSVAKRLEFALQVNAFDAKTTESADNEYFASEDEEDDNEEDDLEYYINNDEDAHTDEMTEKIKEEELESSIASNFFKHSGSEMAVKRLVKDMRAVSRESVKFGIIAVPKENNLFVWEVKLVDIPQDSKLGCDLVLYAKKYKTEPVIHLNMQFPQDYPFSPPFIRVVKPRFQFLTGHVTIGGSICMQMLTKSGWSPTNDIESILVQVRAEILSDPRASLNLTSPDVEYSESEAMEAFNRMLARYGW